MASNTNDSKNDKDKLPRSIKYSSQSVERVNTNSVGHGRVASIADHGSIYSPGSNGNNCTVTGIGIGAGDVSRRDGIAISSAVNTNSLNAPRVRMNKLRSDRQTTSRKNSSSKTSWTCHFV